MCVYIMPQDSIQNLQFKYLGDSERNEYFCFTHAKLKILRSDDTDLREFFSSSETQVSNLTLAIFHLPLITDLRCTLCA